MSAGARSYRLARDTKGIGGDPRTVDIPRHIRRRAEQFLAGVVLGAIADEPEEVRAAYSAIIRERTRRNKLGPITLDSLTYTEVAGGKSKRKSLIPQSL